MLSLKIRGLSKWNDTKKGAVILSPSKDSGQRPLRASFDGLRVTGPSAYG